MIDDGKVLWSGLNDQHSVQNLLSFRSVAVVNYSESLSKQSVADSILRTAEIASQQPASSPRGSWQISRLQISSTGFKGCQDFGAQTPRETTGTLYLTVPALSWSNTLPASGNRICLEETSRLLHKDHLSSRTHGFRTVPTTRPL